MARSRGHPFHLWKQAVRRRSHWPGWPHHYNRLPAGPDRQRSLLSPVPAPGVSVSHWPVDCRQRWRKCNRVKRSILGKKLKNPKFSKIDAIIFTKKQIVKFKKKSLKFLGFYCLQFLPNFTRTLAVEPTFVVSMSSASVLETVWPGLEMCSKSRLNLERPAITTGQIMQRLAARAPVQCAVRIRTHQCSLCYALSSVCSFQSDMLIV